VKLLALLKFARLLRRVELGLRGRGYFRISLAVLAVFLRPDRVKCCGEKGISSNPTLSGICTKKCGYSRYRSLFGMMKSHKTSHIFQECEAASQVNGGLRFATPYSLGRSRGSILESLAPMPGANPSPVASST
jgi:hypothetical protein